MREALLLLLIVASGFVASGLIAALYRVIAGTPNYAPQPKTEAGKLAAVGLTIFTGPAVLTFNAMKADPAEQPRAYLMVVLSVVALWSYVLGLFVLTLAIRIPSPF
jgi:hypothetical protein